MTKKKEEQKQWVTVRVDANTERLYGSLDDAILYLSEVREQYRGFAISLDEHWTGYEDMEMTLVYQREETDQEFAHRLRAEEDVRLRAQEKQRKDAERAAILKQIEGLKAKL